MDQNYPCFLTMYIICSS